MENNQKTEPDRCFGGYGLSGEITETLALLGYEHPTRVQEEVLPHVLAGRNVVVRSQTGTGKTAAFAIPVCEQIVWEETCPRLWCWSQAGSWPCRSARRYSGLAGKNG